MPPLSNWRGGDRAGDDARWHGLLDRLPFRLGIIPSEISDDLDVALPVVRELGLRHVELSYVYGKPFQSLSSTELREVAARLHDAGMEVVVGGTECLKPVLIGHVRDDPREEPYFREHLAMLRHALSAARLLGASIVRLYAFRKEGMVGLGNPSPILPGGGSIPDHVVEMAAIGLRLAGDLALDAGITLAVENVRSCWANTGGNTATLVAAADHPAVRICWDPANDHVSGGVPYPSGYEAVRPYLVSVHLKDARIVDRAGGYAAWAPVGTGEVDLVAQLRALIADGFRGLASLETHWATSDGSRAEGTRISFAGLVAAIERAGECLAE